MDDNEYIEYKHEQELSEREKLNQEIQINVHKENLASKIIRDGFKDNFDAIIEMNVIHKEPNFFVKWWRKIFKKA